MIGFKPEELVPERKDARTWLALAASAVVHLLVTLLLIFGLPVSSVSSRAAVPADQVTAQPLTLQQPAYRPPPTRREPRPAPPPTPTQPTPPPPPPREVELGPDSKKPDARAKEAAAKETVTEPAATTPPTKLPESVPAANAEPAKPVPQPVAPPRLRIARPGDYAPAGALPMPTTSAFAPPKLDSASGAPANGDATAAAAPPSMGRAGLPSREPGKWENSFDDETSGRCVAIPDLGKNADGSPVLATVIGRVLDTDGRTPLSGAHLQIMGTQFGTFSSAAGEYRLEFDPRLLAKCRKQYVDVVAPGYARQLLTLMIGPRIRSDDVVLHH